MVDVLGRARYPTLGRVPVQEVVRLSDIRFDAVPELIDALRRGEIVVLVDDEDRENEGDLVMAAQHATTEHVNFMVREGRGLVCLALAADQVDRLGLELMVPEHLNRSARATAFTTSIEAASGVTTGISAADRARTIQVAGSPDSGPSDVVTPGHVFPIRARPGGVLERAGHTEASVDLCRLAGLWPAAAICEILNPDGTMARRGDLQEFARQHGLRIGTVADLVRFRAAA